MNDSNTETLILAQVTRIADSMHEISTQLSMMNDYMEKMMTKKLPVDVSGEIRTRS